MVLAMFSSVSCGGGSAISWGQFVDRFAAAACARVLTCCSGASGNPAEATCELNYLAAAGPIFNGKIATDHVRYSDTAAAACISDFIAQSCGAIAAGAIPSSCGDVLIGTQPNGAGCSSSAECASSLCINLTIDNSGAVTATGICAAPGALAQPCSASSTNTESSGLLCAAGSYATHSGSSCTCSATLANGAACPDGNAACSSGYCHASGGRCAAFPQTASLTAPACSALFMVY